MLNKRLDFIITFKTWVF